MDPRLRVRRQGHRVGDEKSGQLGVGRSDGALREVRIDELDDPSGPRDPEELGGGSRPVRALDVLEDALGANGVELTIVAGQIPDVPDPEVDVNSGIGRGGSGRVDRVGVQVDADDAAPRLHARRDGDGQLTGAAARVKESLSRPQLEFGQRLLAHVREDRGKHRHAGQLLLPVRYGPAAESFHDVPFWSCGTPACAACTGPGSRSGLIQRPA
jgi:hypothetical protein